jgi:hypothetical protein
MPMDWEPLLANICEMLENQAVSQDIESEEHFERQFVEPIVRKCVAADKSHRDVYMATHPWTKPDTPRPFSVEHKAAMKCWADCKKWANATGWGMTHTLDIFVFDKTSEGHDCIAIEVKLCKATGRRMPTGEFQRMIGQSALFLGQNNHKAVVAVFGFKGEASDALDDNGMSEALRKRGIWPVVLQVP